MNFSRQPAEQKKWRRPSRSTECLAKAGSTLMPHTGSLASGLAPPCAWPECGSCFIFSPLIASGENATPSHHGKVKDKRWALVCGAASRRRRAEPRERHGEGL